MMRLTIISLTLLLLPLAGKASVNLYDVTLPSEQDLARLESLDCEIVHREGLYCILRGTLALADSLLVHGFHPDLYRLDVERLDTDPELDDMAGYPTYLELQDWVQEFASDHPDLVLGPQVIGQSCEGLDIWVMKLSDNVTVDETGEAEVFLNAAIHGDEILNPLVLKTFAERLVDEYDSNPRAQAVVDNCQIWFQFVVNPDGYLQTESMLAGGSLWGWRDNRRRINGALAPVDLNRNFPTAWVPMQGHGTEPGSEPETQAMMNFFTEHRFIFAMNFHSQSDVLLRPFGYSMQPHPRQDFYQAYMDEINASLHWQTGGSELMYLINGSAMDWQDETGDPCFAFTSEVGLFGHIPPVAVRDSLVDAQMEPLLRVCELSMEPQSPLPPSPPRIVVPDRVPPTFSLSVEPLANPWSIPAARYLVVRLLDPVEDDPAEQAVYSPWALYGFRHVSSTPFRPSGAYACKEPPFTSTRYMVTREWHTVEMGDELTMRLDYHFPNTVPIRGDARILAYTHDWTPHILPSKDADFHDYFLRGDRSGNISFDLDEIVGEEVLFSIEVRLREVPRDCTFYFYVDDIDGVPSFRRADTVGVVSGGPLAVTLDSEDHAGEVWFTARAGDGNHWTGSWSTPVATTIDSTMSFASEPTVLPGRFSLSEPAPNPFNPSTALSVALPRAAEVTVHVHDVLGREVAQVREGQQPAGTARFTLDGTRWATGLYFVTVEAREANGSLHRAVRKAMLVK